MSKRRHRTTRTITFRGGPDDGIVGQHPLGYDEIRANTVFHPNGEAIGWDEYRGPGGAGAAEFHYTRHVGTTHEEFLRGEPPKIGAANVYVAPAGSGIPTMVDLATEGNGWVPLGRVEDGALVEDRPTADEPLRTEFEGVPAAVCDRCQLATFAIAAVDRPHIVCGGTFRVYRPMAVRMAEAAANEPRPHA